MSIREKGGGKGGGGGVGFADPPRIFSGATLAACRTARDTHFSNAANAAELARYQRSQYLAILLKPNAGSYTTETYLTGQLGQAYNAANWVNRSSSEATDAYIDSRIAPPVRANNPSGTLSDSVIPQSIARDNEITRSFLLSVLGLSAQELNDLFVGAVVSGSGAGRVITVNQADGSTVTLNVPDTTGGGGGGGSGNPVTRAAFASDGTTLTLTLTDGTTVAASVPAALRQAGLSQSQVQALIDAAEADDLDAADVAAQISAELASYRRLPSIVEYNQNTIIPAANRGWTYRATGNTTRLLSIPNASGVGEVPNGWEFVASNGSSADQSISPNGADTIGGNAGLTLAPGRAVRLQKVATGTWIIIADTKDETGSADLPTVVNVSADTAIPATAFGDTYRVTGNVARTIMLPDPDDVPLGWFIRVANGSGAGVDHSVARQGAGQSIEGGPGPLAVRSGESVTIQKVNTNEWELIADTSQGAAVTGGALSLSTALTAAQRKAWRNHFGSSRIFQVASALPAIADYNTGDTIVVGRGGATVTPFRDISDASTTLTDTVAGDVIMLLAVGWVRIGNFFSGGIAAAMARAIAEAAQRAAVAAQLAVDTVITLNDALIARKTDGQNLEFSIRHPANAYPGANAIAVSIQGTTRYGASAYNPASPHQAIQVGLQTAELQNLVNNNRLDAGDFVDAQVRFQTGSDDTTAVFVRNIEIPVRLGVPRRFERAVGASASTGNVPAGTHELAVTLIRQNNQYGEKRILISNLAAADRVWYYQLGSSGGTRGTFTARYVAATRTLTYSIGGTGIASGGVKAIGEA